MNPLFLPEAILSILAVLLLCLTLAKNQIGEKALGGLMILFSSALLGMCLFSFGASGNLFSDTYRVDLFSQGFKAVIALGMLFTCLFSKHWNRIPADRLIENNLFLVTGTLGMFMMASAVDLLSLFVALELSAYSLYLLAALKPGVRSSESSVKYLIFGAAASGVSLWGLSLVIGLAGTTSIAQIAAGLPALSSQPAFILGLTLFSLSLLFKLSAFPMHFWAPDVYESASTPAVSFIATASKAAAVAMLVRVFLFSGMPLPFTMILGALAFISMTLGNTAALLQADVKRLLAYSSIAQAGYILVGLLSGTSNGYSTAFFYAFAYVLMNSGAFLVTLLIAKAGRNDNPQVSDFDGLAERAPFMALLLLLSLLSLAGIPPLVGFTGKWVLFTAAMEKGHWFLVLWAVLNSVVSLYYYLTLVKHAYLAKPKDKTPIEIPLSLQITGLFLLAALVGIGIFPNWFITFTEKAIASGLTVL